MNKQMFIVISLMTFFLMSIPFTSFAEESEAGQNAEVRIVHASPNTPSVDVYVNKDKVFSEMRFKDISTHFPLEEGTYEITIYKSGSKPKKAEPLIDESVTIMAGKAYTLAASGKKDELTLFEFKDDVKTAKDEVKLRVIHLSPDAPKIDIYSLDTPLFSNIGFSSETNYECLSEGNYSIDVRPTGQEKPIFNIPNLKLENEKNYTAIAVGLLKGDPAFDVIIALDR